jgi:hypothetical protein
MSKSLNTTATKKNRQIKLSLAMKNLKMGLYQEKYCREIQLRVIYKSIFVIKINKKLRIRV